jgi:hypothetical protein
MSAPAPTFTEATTTIEAKLRHTMGHNCTIRVHTTLTDALIQTILQVDAYKFRQELQYRREEVIEHSNNPGFILITAECDGQPLGIVYGYDEPEGGFFLDTLASMIEGRGIGHTLATLIIIHAENTAHNHVTLYTEEEDEQGRKLRRFYQKMGFTYIGTDPAKGDIMKLLITPEKATELYARYMTKPQPLPLPKP